MTTSAQNPFTVNQGLEIMPPRSGKAYPIPCEEWDMLRDKINKLTNEPWLFQNVGSVLIGAGLSTFTALMAGTPPASDTKAVTIAWAVVATTGILGVGFWIFGGKERQVQRDRASEVVAQMDLIEKRYRDAGR